MPVGERFGKDFFAARFGTLYDYSIYGAIYGAMKDARTAFTEAPLCEVP